MSKISVPPLIEQYRMNMLDKSVPDHIRFNYHMSLENIRDYCDAALREYERQSKGGRR